MVTDDKIPEEESDKPHREGSPLLQCNRKSASTSRDESTTGTRAPTDELQIKLFQRREREKNKDALKEFESKVFGSKKWLFKNTLQIPISSTIMHIKHMHRCNVSFNALIVLCVKS